MDPKKREVQAGPATEGIGGVPLNTGNGTGSPSVLLAGTAPAAVLAALGSDDHQAFIGRCDPSAREMRHWRERWGTKAPTDILSPADLRSALGVLENYDQHCLSTLDRLDGKVNRRGTLGYLTRRVGVLRFQGEPICTGTWVGPRWVLTARHCLFDARYDANEGKIEYRPRARELLTFQLASNSAEGVAVAGHIDSRFYNGRSTTFVPTADLHDVVILELRKDPASGAYEGVRAARPEDYSRLVLFALQRNASLIGVIRKHVAAAEQPVASAGSPLGELLKDTIRRSPIVRFDSEQTCRIARIERGGCLAHACQTEFQTSGAPLFRLTANGALELVGIHTRSVVTNDAGECAYSDHGRVPNVGIQLPKEFVDRIVRIQANKAHSGLAVQSE